MNTLFRTAFGLLLLSLFSPVLAQEKDSDYAIQGEYSGMIGDEKFGLQVIALGNHKFTGVGYSGGLPGDGWDRETPERVEKVELTDGAV
ncbi:MAG: hypothetical protein AAF497_21865, partial [Planctomycetota bacterium]